MNRLLHNMSTPPKSVIRYEGPKTPEKAQEAIDEATANGSTLLLRITIPQGLRTGNIKKIFTTLGVAIKPKTKEALLEMILFRTQTLPFPDVLPLASDKARAFSLVGLDDLAILSLATQSSGFAWFRGRTPDLSRLTTLESLTLCIRPLSVPDFSKRFTSHDNSIIDYKDS